MKITKIIEARTLTTIITMTYIKNLIVATPLFLGNIFPKHLS